ncbi:MAG TPA: acyltransferase [Lacunisphaera sp.]
MSFDPSAVRRNGWIDTLRAASALAVALFHLNVVPLSVPPGPLAGAWHGLWQHGHLGVAVFFALGGYCLVPGWSRASGPREFLLRRFRRILPPYWCSLLLVVALAVIMKLATGVNDVAALPHTPAALLATLTIMTSPVTGIAAINWVYWTLSCMLAFYLLTGLSLVADHRHRANLIAGLHAALCLVDVLLHPPASGALFFVRHWPVFGLGFAVALWSLNRPVAQLMLTTSVLHGIGLVVRSADDAVYLAVGALSAGLLILTDSRRLPGMLQVLRPVGRIAYSLYLVHVPVGIYVLLRFLPAGFDHAATFIGAQLLWLAGVVVAAALFYFACERPFSPPPMPTA